MTIVEFAIGLVAVAFAVLVGYLVPVLIQMRKAVAARFQLAVGHGFAGRGHDESGLQRTQMGVLAGIHGLSVLPTA